MTPDQELADYFRHPTPRILSEKEVHVEFELQAVHYLQQWQGFELSGLEWMYLALRNALTKEQTIWRTLIAELTEEAEFKAKMGNTLESALGLAIYRTGYGDVRTRPPSQNRDARKFYEKHKKRGLERWVDNEITDSCSFWYRSMFMGFYPPSMFAPQKDPFITRGNFTIL